MKLVTLKQILAVVLAGGLIDANAAGTEKSFGWAKRRTTYRWGISPTGGLGCRYGAPPWGDGILNIEVVFLESRVLVTLGTNQWRRVCRGAVAFAPGTSRSTIKMTEEDDTPVYETFGALRVSVSMFKMGEQGRISVLHTSARDQLSRR
jgi:hypothetical protein